jgi:hypothetical protein
MLKKNHCFNIEKFWFFFYSSNVLLFADMQIYSITVIEKYVVIACKMLLYQHVEIACTIFVVSACYNM